MQIDQVGRIESMVIPRFKDNERNGSSSSLNCQFVVVMVSSVDVAIRCTNVICFEFHFSAV